MATNTREIRETTRDERVALAGMIVRLFDAWQLSAVDGASLLGLSTRNRAALAGYRRGEPIGGNEDLQDRASYLLGIHKSLRLMFPQNRDLAYAWPTSPNKRLNGLTPVQFIQEKGLAGLAAIRAMLDFERGR